MDRQPDTSGSATLELGITGPVNLEATDLDFLVAGDYLEKTASTLILTLDGAAGSLPGGGYPNYASTGTGAVTGFPGKERSGVTSAESISTATERCSNVIDTTSL